MQPSQPSEREILQQVLSPLFEDFQYWFERSLSLLEKEEMPFFSTQEQTNLIERIKIASAELKVAQTLFNATEGKAGVETQILMTWHNLVAECWAVARKWREYKQEQL